MSPSFGVLLSKVDTLSDVFTKKIKIANEIQKYQILRSSKERKGLPRSLAMRNSLVTPKL